MMTCSTGIQSTIMLAVSGNSTPDSSTAPSQMQFWQLHSLSDGCSEGCEAGAFSQSEQQQHTGVADWLPPAAFASHERQRTGHAIKRAINSKVKRGLFIQFSLVSRFRESKSSQPSDRRTPATRLSTVGVRLTLVRGFRRVRPIPMRCRHGLRRSRILNHVGLARATANLATDRF